MDIREKIGQAITDTWGDYPNYKDESLSQILALIKEANSICHYCGEKPDGAMLTMGEWMAHATCVIRKLNELLDPEWDGKGEPDKIVGFLAGYVKPSAIKVCAGCPDRFEGCVKLADDQSIPSNPYMNGTSTELGWQQGVDDMLTVRDGTVWRKVKLAEG